MHWRGAAANVAFSADPIVVAAGGGWQKISFSLAEADLVAGVGSLSAAVSNTTVLRLFQGEADAFPGEPSVPLLGADHIQAVAVPEPASWALMIAGFRSVGAMAHRRHLHPLSRTSRNAQVRF